MCMLTTNTLHAICQHERPPPPQAHAISSWRNILAKIHRTDSVRTPHLQLQGLMQRNRFRQRRGCQEGNRGCPGYWQSVPLGQWCRKECCCWCSCTKLVVWGKMRRRGVISREKLEISWDVRIRRGEPEPASWMYGVLRRQGRQRSGGRCGAVAEPLWSQSWAPPASSSGLERCIHVPLALQASAAHSACRRALPFFLFFISFLKAGVSFSQMGAWIPPLYPRLTTHLSCFSCVVWRGGGRVLGPGCWARAFFSWWFLDILFSSGKSTRLPPWP